MTHYQKWTVIVNGADLCLFIDDKEATKVMADPSAPKLSEYITSIEEIRNKDGLIQISLGDAKCILKTRKFTKTTLFSCPVETTEDLLKFWNRHSDFLLDDKKNCCSQKSLRDGSVDLFESCNSQQEKEDSRFINFPQNSCTKENSLTTNESDIEDDSDKLTRNYLFNIIGKKKVTYKVMDVFTLLDPPVQYKVRDTNKEFVDNMASKMIEKKSISVDNAPTVIGMIEIDAKDFIEEDFSNYKDFVIDGNHSVQAQKVAYKKTKSALFRYRGVNIYCGLTANEAVLLGISRNDDTEAFCKFSDLQKVELVRRRLYDVTNTNETEDPPKQPKNFKDIFACLLNLQGKKAMDGKNTLRFLATSLFSRCFQLYREICHRHSRNVPVSKFECLKGLQEEDIFTVLFNLSLTDLDRDSWQQFAVGCQEKQKKPKKHRKDVTVTFQFNEVSTQGFLDQKPMHGNCVNYRFIDGEEEAILSCKELKELVFSSEIRAKFLEVSTKDPESAFHGSTCLPARINSKSDIIVPESPSSGSNEEADNSTELSLDKGISSFTSIHSSLRVDLTKKAKCMHKEIKNFLDNYKASSSSQLPRANDVHLIPFLVTSTNDDPSSEYQIDELANFLCANYPRLQDFASQDVSSLLHNTVQFIINYRQGEDKPQDHEVSESSRKDSLLIASTSSQGVQLGESGSASMTVPVDSSSTLQESSLSADISSRIISRRKSEAKEKVKSYIDRSLKELASTPKKESVTKRRHIYSFSDEDYSPIKISTAKKTRLLYEGDVSQKPTKQKRTDENGSEVKELKNCKVRLTDISSVKDLKNYVTMKRN